MKIIHLYYATGTILVLLVLVLSLISDISIENMIIFALVGFLLIILGIIQHIIILNEKYYQIKIKMEAYTTKFHHNI